MILALLAIAAVNAADTECAYDKSAMLALSPQAFDQDLKGGWRPLADKPGCEGAAADLLAVYRTAHWGKLKPNELEINYWHEGQLRADLDQRAAAVRLLMSGVGPESGDDFEDYALGTVAFLQRDRSSLISAIARLKAQPEPPEWKALQAQFKAKSSVTPAWPPNLDVLEGLLACFDKPYEEAYGSDACRKRPSAPATR